MASVIRRLSTAGSRSFASSAMTCLAPGQQLVGAKYEYRLLSNLGEKGKHNSIVFDAQVLPKAGATDPPQWFIPTRCASGNPGPNLSSRAVVKTAQPGDSASELNLKREYDTYCRTGVNSSSCFREMYDIVEEPWCLVFRRMEQTLDELPYEPSTRCHNIIADLLIKAVSACTVLHGDEPRLVETGMTSLSAHSILLTSPDWKIDKILISNAGSDHPIVRIGDLGLGKPALSDF